MAKEEKKKPALEFEIVDIDVSQVPKHLLLPNTKAIMELIKSRNGNLKISGVHFKKKTNKKEEVNNG